MTATLVSMIQQAGSAQTAVSDTTKNMKMNGQASGERFSSVIRSAVRNASRHDSSAQGTSAQPQGTDAVPAEQGEVIFDQATMNLMQQVMGSLLLANPQMNPQQLQNLAAQLTARIMSMQSVESGTTTAQPLGQLMADLRQMLDANGFAGILKTADQSASGAAETVPFAADGDSMPDAEQSVSAKIAPHMVHSFKQSSETHVDTSKNGFALPEGFQPVEHESVSDMIDHAPANTLLSSVVSAGSYHQTTDDLRTIPKNDVGAAVAVQDIHEPIRAAAETGTKNIVLRLDPPDLGQVHVRLRMNQGVLTADLKVDSGSTKDIFTSAIPQIRASLENAGIRVGELQVDLREDYLADQGAHREQNDNQNQRRNQAPREQFFEYLA